MKVIRAFVIAALFVGSMAIAATPASAGPISILVGDKDGFGIGLAAGADFPWNSPIVDTRSSGERTSTNGAELTDTYSALYAGSEIDCTGPGNTCSLNGDTGTVYMPFAGQLTSGAITINMADFQCIHGAMTVTINNVAVPFCFDDGWHKTAIRTFALSPQMIANANAAGEIEIFFDHRISFDPQLGRFVGSFDYIAFDYFELNADTVPEPGTWLLIGTGLAVFGARRLRRTKRAH